MSYEIPKYVLKNLVNLAEDRKSCSMHAKKSNKYRNDINTQELYNAWCPSKGQIHGKNFAANYARFLTSV